MSVIDPSGDKRQEIFNSLKELLDDITEDWELGEITENSRLVDFGLESISLVYLITELQQMYGLQDRLFEKMRSEGSLLKDMTVGDILSSLNELMDGGATTERGFGQ